MGEVSVLCTRHVTVTEISTKAMVRLHMMLVLIQFQTRMYSLRLDLVEVKTKLEYTTGVLDRTDNELVSTKTEMYKTRELDQMKMQVMRLQNKLRNSQRQVKHLQNELQTRPLSLTDVSVTLKSILGIIK